MATPGQMIHPDVSLADWDPLARDDYPFPVYRLLRDNLPVHRSAKSDSWTLSRFEDVQAAVRDWQTFSSGDGVGIDDESKLYQPGRGAFIEQDPPEHDRLRHLLASSFAPKHLRRAVEPVIRSTARRLVSLIRRRASADLVADLALPLPHTVVSAMIGFPRSDHDQLAKWVVTMHRRRPNATELPVEALVARDEFRDYIDRFVRLRLAEPEDDLLSTMVSGVRQGTLSSDDTKGMCTLLYFAGTGTTTQLISEALLILEQHPDQRDRLRAQPADLPAAIEEVLRYEPPVLLTARRATRAVKLHNELIGEGDRVVLLLGSANRDDRRWDEPDSFDATRTPLRHLAFADGIHHCIGAPLARLESRIVLEEFLAQIPHYVVNGPIERSWTPYEHPLTTFPISIA
jgi:cytochrome P450